MNLIRFCSLTVLLLLIASALQAHPVAKTESRVRHQEVTLVQMQQAILGAVRSQKDAAVADVQVRLFEPEHAITLPGGRLGMQVVAVPPAEGYGRREFDVVLSVNGTAIHTSRATADIIALVDVVVATRLIKIDETIQAQDVRVARTLLTTVPLQYALNVDDVIGKRAARPLAPHAPISVSNLGEPYLVRKGDRVTIEAKSGRLLIQTVGVMKAAGQVGQMVTVTNQDSGKDLRAKVIGPGLVRVDF